MDLQMHDIADAVMVLVKIAGILIVIALVLAIYLLPTFVAAKRNSESFSGIVVRA